MAFTVGLTGGIGSGKSLAADMLGELGASIVDTDLIAHQLTAPRGAAMPSIVAAFGPEFATAEGALNRARMRELVFADPQAKSRLEAILHPMIRSEAASQAARASGKYVVFVVPLLVESGGWKERVSRVCVVDCPESLQIARVMARNNLPEAQVRAIMAAQASRSARLAVADDVLTNDGGIEELRVQTARLHQLYLSCL